MKTTIVLAVLLGATPAFAQYGSSYGYGQGSPGATLQDYRLAPHQRTTRQRRLHITEPTRNHLPAVRVRPHTLHHMQPPS
jgi:hypothetical protein